MHLRAYRDNEAINGVCHAHPIACTSFAAAGLPLDKALYSEAVVNLGTIPCAPYATPGTEEVPDSIAPYLHDYNGVLLGNHGALSWGRDLFEAYYRLESMEHYAMILMNTGFLDKRPRLFSKEQVDDLLDIRRSLGIMTGGVPEYRKY